MKLIDPNVLKQQDFQDYSESDVEYAIDHCPTVEAEPIIRCKNCKQCDSSRTTTYLGITYKYCNFIEGWCEPNDYCAWAEKIDELTY